MIATETAASHYVEFACVPETDISTGFLMGRLMHAVHLTLVNATPPGERCPIGVTFPGYQMRPPGGRRFNASHPPIGDRLRLFAHDAAVLESLPWGRSLVGMDDYLDRTAARPIERVDRYAIYSRRQPSGSVGRKIRRAMRRHGLTEAEASARYADYQAGDCDLPYVDMRSESNGHRFRLFIDRRDGEPGPVWGFSTYGLSGDVALPEF